MALISPIEPMLAEACRTLPPEGALPGGWIAEQKADGFRAILFARPGHVLLQSRRGSDLTPAFPDLVAAASGLGEALVLDGELVVPHGGRLDFGALQSRARRRGPSAAQAAEHRPAYLIVFDVLEAAGTEQMVRPYRERRAVLEDLFARDVLGAPFTLCPYTTDRATAQDWLDPAWGAVGIEGVVLKGLAQPYLPGKRAWIKVRSRITSEAVIGAVTGSPKSPLTLLLGRYDASGDLRMVARTTVLNTAARRDLGQRLAPAGSEHPWHGRHFSAGWGAGGELEFRTARPELWPNSSPTPRSTSAATATRSASYVCATTSPRTRRRPSPPDIRPTSRSPFGWTDRGLLGVRSSSLRATGGSRRRSRVPVFPGA